MSDVAPAPAPRRSHHEPLSKVKNLSDAFGHPEFMARIKQAVPKHMSPDRMLATFILAVRKTPKLMQVDMMSFLGACIGLASVGLEPNTPLGHAYLIPFDEKKWNPTSRQRELVRTNVQVIFGYGGLLELAYRSGLVRSVHADVAWRGDEFDFHYGSGQNLRHKPKGGIRQAEEMPEWAYMHASMKGEAEAFEVMPISDVLRVRDATQAYSSALYAREEAQKKGWKEPAAWTEAPWVRHFVPMARKTVFRAGSKWLPKSIELAAALAWDELQDRKNLNYGAVIEGSADVLDGGLSALEDSSGGLPEPDFSIPPREQDNVPLRPGREAPPAQHQVKMPDWIGYVVDEQGETVGEAHTDPLAFAQALGNLWTKRIDQEGVLAANAEYIEKARSASPNAAAILNALDQQTFGSSTSRSGPGSTKAAPGDPANMAGPFKVDLTSQRGSVSWPAYLKLLRESLRAITATQLPEWSDLNLPTILQAPDVHRLMIVKIVQERAVALGVDLPEGIRAAIQGFAGVDADKRWADDAITDINDAPTEEQLDIYLAGDLVRRQVTKFETERPDLAAQLKQAVAERRQQLSEPDLDVLPEDDGFPGDRAPIS